MAKTSYDVNDPTKRAVAQLFFEHTRKISDITTSGNNLSKLGLAVKMAKATVSIWLDDDPKYFEELESVRQAFQDVERPTNMEPKQWGWERRLEEWECIQRSMIRYGIYKTWSLEYDREPL